MGIFWTYQLKILTESLWCQSRLLLYLDHWRLGFVRFRAVSTYLHKVTGSCVKQSTQLLKQNKWVYDVSLSFSKTPADNSKVHIGSLTLSKIWISLFRRLFGIKVWSHNLRHKSNLFLSTYRHSFFYMNKSIARLSDVLYKLLLYLDHWSW